MASAIFSESSASAMAVFISTPSKPSSIAIAASDAVPTPASTISGTSVMVSRRIRRLVTFWMPRPDRWAPQGHHRRRAGVDQFARVHQIVVGIGKHHEPLSRQYARRFQQALRYPGTASSDRRSLPASPSSTSPLRAPAAPCGSLHRPYSSAAVLGRMNIAGAIDIIQQRFFRLVRQIDAPHRNRHHLGSRNRMAPRHFLKAAVLAGTDK